MMKTKTRKKTSKQKKQPQKRRYEVEMGIELLKALSRHKNGLTTRLLLKEANVNHEVLKRAEKYMISAGLLTRKKEGPSLRYRATARAHRVLQEYARISGYFEKRS